MKYVPIALPMPPSPVQHDPDPICFVEADLDEMIAAAERAHLLHPVLRALEALRELRMRLHDRFQLGPEWRNRMDEFATVLVLVPPDVAPIPA